MEIDKHPPEHKNEEPIAGESKCAKVEQLVLVRVVLCQLECDSVRFGSEAQLETLAFQ